MSILDIGRSAVGILVTDGGTHPPEKWADNFAQALISIEATALSEAIAAGMALRDKVRVALLDVFAAVKGSERNALVRHGHRHLRTATVLDHHVAAGAAAITAAAAGTPFEDHFRLPIVRKALNAMLAEQFAHAVNNERDWWKANEQPSPSD